MSDYVSVWKQCIRRIGALPEDERERVVASISILFLKEAVRALKPAPSEPAAPSFYEDYKRENNLVHELRQAVDQLTRVRNAHADEIERLRAENEAIRKSISDGDYGPTAAELQRFRDREEKLDALWPQLQRLGEHYGWEEEIEHAIAAVRDFKG